MTYLDLYTEAILKFERGKITLNEYKNIIKPLMKEIRTEPWIPCSEKLPKEKDERVLITLEGKVTTAIYSEFLNTWYIGDMCGVSDKVPTAWMPLPEPYRKEENNV